MDLGKVPLFSLIVQRLSWLSDRQRVLSENVANADTPGYRPKDLKAFEFQRHLAAGEAAGGSRPALVTRKPAETTLSGNAVQVENELMKVAETAMDHQVAIGLYRKQIGLLKAVLTRS